MVEVLLAGPPPVSRFTLSNRRKHVDGTQQGTQGQTVLDVGKGHIKEDLEAVRAVDPCSLVLALRHGLPGLRTAVGRQRERFATRR